MSFKAEFKPFGEEKYATNAIVVATKAEAERYAADLYARWTMAEAYRVFESDEVPNYKINLDNGTPERIG